LTRRGLDVERPPPVVCVRKPSVFLDDVIPYVTLAVFVHVSLSFATRAIHIHRPAPATAYRRRSWARTGLGPSSSSRRRRSRETHPAGGKIRRKSENSRSRAGTRPSPPCAAAACGQTTREWRTAAALPGRLHRTRTGAAA